MKKHTKSVIMTWICTYLRSKPKSGMVGFAWSDGVSNVTLTMQLFGRRVIGDACHIAQM